MMPHSELREKISSASADPQQLIQIVHNRLAEFDAGHAAQAIHQIAKIYYGTRGKEKGAFIVKTRREVDELCEVIRSPRFRDSANPEHVSMALWALNILKRRDTKTIRSIADRVTNPKLGFDCRAQIVASTLWGFASLEYKDNRTIKVLTGYLRQPDLCKDLDSRHASRALWSLAKLGYPDHKAIKALYHLISLPNFTHSATPRDLSSSLWALATLGLHNSDTVMALTHRLTNPLVLAEFTAGDIATSLWALALLDQDLCARCWGDLISEAKSRSDLGVYAAKLIVAAGVAIGKDVPEIFYTTAAPAFTPKTAEPRGIEANIAELLQSIPGVSDLRFKQSICVYYPDFTLSYYGINVVVDYVGVDCRYLNGIRENGLTASARMRELVYTNCGYHAAAIEDDVWFSTPNRERPFLVQSILPQIEEGRGSSRR